MNRSILTLPLLGLLGSGLMAQEPAVLLAAGLTDTQGSLLDLTQKRKGGYTFEAGFQIAPQDYGATFLFYGGFAKFPAADPSPGRPTYVVASPRVGLDIQYHPWDQAPVTLFTGPSLHIWQVEQKGVSGDARQGDQGLKFGWRLGGEMALTKEVGLSLAYTFSAWHSLPASDYQEGYNPSRPAYWSLMARYRF